MDIMRARAAAYAQHRLAQLRAIAPMLTPEIQTFLGNQGNLDPAAAWRGISGAFAQAAHQQGYQDPRMMLQMAHLNPGQRAGY